MPIFEANWPDNHLNIFRAIQYMRHRTYGDFGGSISREAKELPGFVVMLEALREIASDFLMADGGPKDYARRGA